MKAILKLALVRLGLVSASLCIGTAGATEVWDGLPAMEPVHLQGIYTGKQVCPMCAHGYDAGLLIFVPESLAPAEGRLLARNTKPTALGIDAERFRVFIVVTGQPTTQLLDSLAVEDKRWFVVSLQGDALKGAQRDIGESLRQDLRGFVFAQRRLLHVFTRDELLGARPDQLRAQSNYALELLRIVHPTQKQSSDPNLPQVAMWFAPVKLHPRVDLRTASEPGKTACFIDEDRRVLGGALAQVPVQAEWASLQGDATYRWARTDVNGCLELGGLRATDAISMTLHSNLEPTRHATFRTAQLGSPRSTVVARVAQNETNHQPNQLTRSEQVVGLPCDGCENVPKHVPTVLTSASRIAPLDEPGEPMHLAGRIVDANGQPAPGAILYAYQTNQKGVYVRDQALTPPMKLRGWVQADVQGRYKFDTIRPGTYPSRTEPAHIHMHVVEPGRCTYYIDNVVFRDDPLLSVLATRNNKRPRGGSGLTEPAKDANGVWQVTRDIQLGLNVPGYELCRNKL